MSSRKTALEETTFDEAGFEKALSLIKSLDNRNRLLMLCLLCDQDLNVSELAQASDLSLSAVSQHLTVLKAAQLVDTTKAGQTVTYRLVSDDVRSVVALLKQLYCRV